MNGDPRVPQLRHNMALLTEMLQSVQVRPDVEVVHRLRTSTRRCAAIAQSLLHERNCIPEQARSSRKLLRQWKKVRRKTGTVRDLDVHRKLLAGISAGWTGTALIEHAGQLEACLHSQRRHAEAKLVKTARTCAPKIAALTAEVAPWLLTPPRRAAQDPGALAVADFARVAAHFLALDAQTLHDFRKRTKEARYVAEAGGAPARRIERALKQIQDSIGSWHDLEALLAEAEHCSRDADDLLQQLREPRDSAYRAALETSARIRARLLGEFYSSIQRPRVRRTER